MKDYYSLLKYLKKNLNIRRSVSIRRVKLSAGTQGEAILARDIFLVKIDKNLSEISAIDTMIHEIAHCLAWSSDQGHGKRWGIAYSKVYRLYLKWLENAERIDDINFAAKHCPKRHSNHN